MSRRSDGFTIAEVGVIVPIIMLLVIAIFSIMFTFLLSSNREQVRLYQAYSQSSGLNRIEADVRLSTGFLKTNDPALPDPYAPAGGWDVNANSNKPLILNQYATSNNPLSNTRTPVYTLATNASDCSSPTNVAGPLRYTIIYFVNGTTLYRRILINQSDRTCVPQYQKLSCPRADTLSGSRNQLCGADDEEIAQNVSRLSIEYYTNQGDTTPLNVQANRTLLDSARSARVTIENTQSSYNGSVTTASSVKAPNQNSANPGGQ